MFDICVITASHDRQAERFRNLIQKRVEGGLYPREISFKVYSDPPGGRIGSGGGTLWALKSLLKESGSKDPGAFFSEKRILIIHAGGESRRLPCYSPEGKLFAPLPVTTSSLIPPVVLDMQLTLFLKYPWKQGEVVVTSGDVVIDFDTNALIGFSADLCGFAATAPLEEGSLHGVFKFDASQETVIDYYQKADVDFLGQNARIEGTNDCAVDIGPVSMSPAYVATLLNILDSRLETGETVERSLSGGKIEFDLYLEVLSASLPELTVEKFEERITRSTRLRPELQRLFYEYLHPYSLKAVLTRSSTFLHFGTLAEYPRSCRELQYRNLLPFYADRNGEISSELLPGLTLINCQDSEMSVGPEKEVYAENTSQSSFPNLQGRNMIIGLRNWTSNIVIPDGICIDERNIGGKLYRAAYGTDDSFRNATSREELRYCGVPITQWLEERGLTAGDIWKGDEDPDLLTARIVTPFSTEPFLTGYWQPPGDIDTWRKAFLDASRLSLLEINEMTDVRLREEQRQELRKQQVRRRIEGGNGWRNISCEDFREVFSPEDIGLLNRYLSETDDPLLRIYRKALLDDLKGTREPAILDLSREVRFIEELPVDRMTTGIKEDQIVWARAPIRFDLAGGWTDTPPYTMRYGGTVVNMAADLNGQPPVQVFCRRTTEAHLRFHSIDLGVTETIVNREDLLDFRNPTSPFSLPKAALVLMGVGKGRSLDKSLNYTLKQFGGGLEITLLCAVPKGSGLGTSSILGGVILAALHRFFGLTYTLEDLFLKVLQMEQMLTTGGGWQDQIGGLAGGVKYIVSPPGLRPNPILYQLDSYLFRNAADHSCFTLFYTGMTRLAKNILEDVVQRVNTSAPAYLFTHTHLKMLAEKARREISQRNSMELARTLQSYWEAKKLIHESTTSPEIEKLMSDTAEHTRGVCLLGAGGGGYALFVSPDPASADRLRERLEKSYTDGRARIVDFSLSETGLMVSVS